VVLVGLDQDGQDPAEVADVAGGQGLDEVAADPVGVRGPGLLEQAEVGPRVRRGEVLDLSRPAGMELVFAGAGYRLWITDQGG